MRSLLVGLVLLVPITARAQVHVDIDVDVNVHVPPPPPPPAPPPPAEAPPAPAVTVKPVAAPFQATDHSIPATIGIVLGTSAGHIIDQATSQGLGVSALVHPVNGAIYEISVDYERDAFDAYAQRVDHRIGYSLFFGPTTGRLTPYVVVPMGVNIVTRTDLDTKVEGYVGIGVGAKLRFDNWFASADARVLSRSENPSDQVMVLPSEVVLEVYVSVGYVFQ